MGEFCAGMAQQLTDSLGEIELIDGWNSPHYDKVEQYRWENEDENAPFR